MVIMQEPCAGSVTVLDSCSSTSTMQYHGSVGEAPHVDDRRTLHLHPAQHVTWIPNADRSGLKLGDASLKKRVSQSQSPQSPLSPHALTLSEPRIQRLRKNRYYRSSSQFSLRWQQVDWTGEKVDKLCQMCFPLAFICFNWYAKWSTVYQSIILLMILSRSSFYWTYYTTESSRQMASLLNNNENLTGSYVPQH